jgi:hypothetical protein
MGTNQLLVVCEAARTGDALPFPSRFAEPSRVPWRRRKTMESDDIAAITELVSAQFRKRRSREGSTPSRRSSPRPGQ